MSGENQSHMAGSYYGAPIPPPPTSQIRPFRHRTITTSRGGTGCFCLDCLCDCACCAVTCVVQIIISILVFIGLIILVFWLIVRPHAVKFHAADASLTQFNLSSTTTGNSTLSFDLAVNFTARNPNRHIGVYYDEIEARAYYEDQLLGTTSLSPFYQEHKNTTDLGPATFTGQRTVALSSDETSDYDSQKTDGAFKIDVKLYMKVRFKLGLFKTRKYKPKAECDLKIPLTGAGGNSSSGEAFQSTKCHYDL